jgi:4-hydroxybenzoate polyprenyltransferase
LPDSILEDETNKPWRPIPAQRISSSQARRLLLFVIPVALLVSAFLGTLHECLFLVIMTWMYNDLGGADENFMIRNMLNALGITCYSSASVVLATGKGHENFTGATCVWLTTVCGIIFSTLQIMDLADMKGDACRGRRTMPLVYGERACRLSVIIPVLFWSYVCPTMFELGFVGMVLSLSVGHLLALRVFLYRGVAQDKVNFKVWSLWTTTLYSLPLLHQIGV